MKVRLTLILASLLLCVACSTTQEQPTGFRKPPLYPGAKPTSVIGQFVDGQLISYDVSATPEDVLSFYKSTLQNEGWAIDPGTESGTVHLVWGGRDGKPMYTVDVTAAANANLSRVDLKVIEIYPK